jgi:hypothetical protein
VVLDALDVAALRLGIDAEEGEEPGQGLVPLLDHRRHVAAAVGEDETTIFHVVEVAHLVELLDHAGDGGLADVERRRDVDHAGIALLLDELVDSFEVVLGALAGARRGGHGCR